MSYAKALKVLKAHPTRELSAGRYRMDDGCMCALGVAVPSTTTAPYYYQWRGIQTLITCAEGVADDIARLGLTERQATLLQRVNDGFPGSRSERYAHVIAWLEAKVAAGRAAARANRLARESGAL